MRSTPASSLKPSGQLPAGIYWIGDLCHVLEDLFVDGFDTLEGVHCSKAGYLFAFYWTEQGDGVYIDNEGDEYEVDVANIGCIAVCAIKQPSELGHYVLFHDPFTCRWIEEGGFICFGDLAIKTASFSDEEYPDSLSQPQEVMTANAAHIKLDPYDVVDLILRDLILHDQHEADSDTQLVMHEIADLLACGGNLFGYADFDEELRESRIWILNMVFYSGLEEFIDFFRGYLVFNSGLENKIHARNLEEGRTKTALHTFLERLDWPRILELCRRHGDDDSVARIFQVWTGLDFAAERMKYPIEELDGTPRWPMESGKFLPSE